jgi:hypothetical protein
VNQKPGRVIGQIINTDLDISCKILLRLYYDLVVDLVVESLISDDVVAFPVGATRLKRSGLLTTPF